MTDREWLVVPDLERLVSCGRSSRYGFRRHCAMRAWESGVRLPELRQAGGAASRREADRAAALESGRTPWRAWRALGKLARVPRAALGLAPGGISRRARTAEARRKARSALRDAEAALEREPLALARVAAALAREDLGESAEALRHLDAALALEPREGWLHQFRGDVRRRLGDREGFVADGEAAIRLDEGAAYFRFAAGDPRTRSRRRVHEAAGHFIKRHPRAYWMLAYRGDLRRSPEINDFSGAIRDFEAALELRPDAAWVWAYLSRALMAERRGARARDAIDRAVSIDPACGWLHVWRGEVRRRAGEPAAALADFDRGLSLDADYEMGYAWRGGARRALGDPAAALGDLDLACVLDPAYGWTYQERLLALRDLGRVGEALDAGEEALRRDPKYSWFQPGGDPRAAASLGEHLARVPHDARALAWSGLGRLEAGDLSGALGELKPAAALRPDWPWARAWLGRALGLSGLRARAIRELTAAIAIEPRYANSWAWRGRLHLDRRDWPAAARDLRRAARLDPKAAWILEWAGEAELGAGRPRRALGLLGQAVELDRRGWRSLLARAAVWKTLGGTESARRDVEAALRALGNYPSRARPVSELVREIVARGLKELLPDRRGACHGDPATAAAAPRPA